MRLDAAIFAAERVGDARLRFAKAPGLQARGVNPLSGEIGDDRRGSPFRQSEIVFFGAGRIRMAVDFEFLILQTRVAQRLGELVEVVLGRLRQLVGVELDRKAHV